jgi:hypothetical protein
VNRRAALLQLLALCPGINLLRRFRQHPEAIEWRYLNRPGQPLIDKVWKKAQTLEPIDGIPLEATEAVVEFGPHDEGWGRITGYVDATGFHPIEGEL